MMPAFASVDISEKLLALVSRYALQSDAVWAMPVQVTILDAVAPFNYLSQESPDIVAGADPDMSSEAQGGLLLALTTRRAKCRWISCRKNTGYHATDPKIRTQGAECGRSWIAMKHGDGSLESSNTQHTAERDVELYPGSGPSW
jgi:hypothetical protein